MDRLSTLQLFVRVLDLGSFTRAARELGLGQPAVSKQVAALEARLGTLLLERSSRGLRPTPAGQDLYGAAVRLVSDLEETENRVRGVSQCPGGVVRVAMPPTLGRMYVIPSLPAFFALYPEIAVEFSVADRRVDLVKEGVDVALRVGDLRPSALVARRIGSLQMIAVASPAYLAVHGTPRSVGDLSSHTLISGQIEGASVPWAFKVDEEVISIAATGRIRSNDGEDLRASVLADLGITYGPTALFRSDLKAGRLVEILKDDAPDPVPVHAVSAGGRKMAQRVRLFTDHLAATFAAEPSLRHAFQSGIDGMSGDGLPYRAARPTC
ncbi:transcriptional regulator [Azorhizobium oxalatiphilum]|uniref:Transcriptional regulator n=1 Tax=Azorhizobium oxalatiphilum TaxID=980631 RepID=A0A917FK51_9HYPH|nr:LysR family transcriptional regulator [Azorhizobium oxalatiphilum]GGF85812.1 transcriptional regulator [Azorhizobium oxalatiphilum]